MAKPSSNQNDHSRLENGSMKSRQFKGIRMTKWGKWVSEIRMPDSRDRIWLGSYDTPEDAARAFDFAMYCRGSKANFNFPYSLSDIPDASSVSTQQIQVAAEEIWLPSEGNTADIHYPSSLCPPQIRAAAANFAAEEVLLASEDNAVDVPYSASPCVPQIQAAAAKSLTEEFWQPSENNATSSCFCLKIQSTLEGQSSVKQGRSHILGFSS